VSRGDGWCIQLAGHISYTATPSTRCADRQALSARVEETAEQVHAGFNDPRYPGKLSY
jgi:hypothetical protein